MSNLINIGANIGALRDVMGWVLPFQGGRYRLTEDYDVYDTGVINTHVNPNNVFLGESTTVTRVGPAKLYARNKSIPVSKAGFLITDIHNEVLNVPFLYALATKPVFAPDSVILDKSLFKLVWTGDLTNETFSDDDFYWRSSQPADVTHGGETYTVLPCAIRAVIRKSDEALVDTLDGSDIILGTRRTDLVIPMLSRDEVQLYTEASLGHLGAIALNITYPEETGVKIITLDPADSVLDAANITRGGMRVSGTTVRVTDTVDDFLRSEDDAPAIVPGNEPPMANFIYSKNELEVTFIDSSADIDGTITSWAWDFGDGNTSTLQSPVHSYASKGSYLVSLTVSDGEATSSKSSLVAVTSPARTMGEIFDNIEIFDDLELTI